MEGFIEERYELAQLLWLYRKCAYYCDIRDMRMFSLTWKKTLNGIEKVVKDACELSAYVTCAASLLHKPTECGAIITENIIPMITEYLNSLPVIDVTEGKWRIVSSSSGYLNLQNANTSEYLHSTADPMWEAYNRANKIYRADMTSVAIMGCGLGYLAYQFYVCSEGSLDIYVYEKDAQIVEYAKAYGVLSLIKPEKLHIVIEGNAEKLFEDFASLDVDYESSRFLIMEWMVDEFDADMKQGITDYIENQSTIDTFADIYEVNFFQNKNACDGDFEELLPVQLRLNEERNHEFIVVAAGPSLNEQAEYIRENKGKKTIIAVDAAYKKLLAVGVNPDYVVILDPLESVMRYIDGVIEETRKSILIADTVAYWNYVHEYEGPKYRVRANDCKLTMTECRALGCDPWSIGGTVSSHATEAAIRLGAKAIEFVGLDLSFPGGKHHADGLGIDSSNTVAGSIWVKSNDGTEVSTSETLDLFRRQMEIQIANNPGVIFRNLSEHGAVIEGTLTGKWWEKLADNTNLEEYAVRVSKESNLSWEQKYYLLWQILCRFDGKSDISKGVEILYKNILDGIGVSMGVDGMSGGPSSLVNASNTKGPIILMTTQFTDYNDGLDGVSPMTTEVLEDAYTILSQTDNKVIIVCTDEFLGGRRTAIEYPIIKDTDVALLERESIVYKGQRIPFVCMDERIGLSAIVGELTGFVTRLNPERIISYSRYSVTASVCEKTCIVKYK